MAVRLGKYELVRKIATGGMGEIHLARAGGAKGFEKLLVIKRVLAHLAENGDFLGLFLDEARIAACLNHPNIVQLFELGEADGSWYLAMEYVDGDDLSRVLARARERELPLPVGAACRVAADALAGLDYAHKAKDAAGRDLHLVHRDVSPHNILLGFDGGVKLIDFGVAKAADQLDDEAGVLRGKYAYMSPEQVAGADVDARSDIFSLGIVLWESLTGQRLFKADTDRETLRQVRACKVQPPSALRADVPPSLDEAVLQALESNPTRRYPDAAAMRLALENLVVDEKLKASSAHLSEYLRRLWALPEPVRGAAASRAQAEAEGAVRPEVTVSERRPGRLRREPSLSQPLECTRSSTAAGHGARGRIPLPARPLVGRELELAELRSRLARRDRLLTLVGPRGVGKTRLALELAREQRHPARERGFERVLYCPVSTRTDEDGVCAALAGALGVRLTRWRPDELVQQVGLALAAHGEVLVVLDDFSKAVAVASTTVAQWLAAAPRACFLVTSEERLGVFAEGHFRVAPLATPAPDAGAEALGASASVRLFVERARESSLDFAPAAAELATIGHVVRELDGLPLAIELAATRVLELGLRRLTDELPRRFERAGRSSSQTTMRNVLAWAVGSLSPSQQRALAQLAVFPGRFDLDAAEAVVPPDLGPPSDAHPTVAEQLKTLVRRGLLTVLPGPVEPTFELPGTLRQHLRAQATTSQLVDQAQLRLARHLPTRGARLPAAPDTYVSTLRHLLAARAPSSAVLELLAAGLPVLPRAASRQARLDLIDGALRLAGRSGPPGATTLVRLARADLLLELGRLPEALADFDLAAQLAAGTGEGRSGARAQLGAALALFRLGNARGARVRLEQAVEGAVQAQDLATEARTHELAAHLELDSGEPSLAMVHWKRVRAIHEEAGNLLDAGHAAEQLGNLAAELGHHHESAAHFEAAVADFRACRSATRQGLAHASLALARSAQGSLDAALDELEAAAELLAECPDADLCARAELARAQLALARRTPAEGPTASAALLRCAVKSLLALRPAA